MLSLFALFAVLLYWFRLKRLCFGFVGNHVKLDLELGF